MLSGKLHLFVSYVTLPFCLLQILICLSSYRWMLVGLVGISGLVVGIKNPICYFSKEFTRCPKNYRTIKKKALALLMASWNFEVCLSNGSTTPIIVYTDHNPLLFLSCMANSNQILMQWSIILLQKMPYQEFISRVHVLGKFCFCFFKSISHIY